MSFGNKTNWRLFGEDCGLVLLVSPLYLVLHIFYSFIYFLLFVLRQEELLLLGSNITVNIFTQWACALLTDAKRLPNALISDANGS